MQFFIYYGKLFDIHFVNFGITEKNEPFAENKDSSITEKEKVG